MAGPLGSAVAHQVMATKHVDDALAVAFLPDPLPVPRDRIMLCFEAGRERRGVPVAGDLFRESEPVAVVPYEPPLTVPVHDRKGVPELCRAADVDRSLGSFPASYSAALYSLRCGHRPIMAPAGSLRNPHGAQHDAMNPSVGSLRRISSPGPNPVPQATHLPDHFASNQPDASSRSRSAFASARCRRSASRPHDSIGRSQHSQRRTRPSRSAASRNSATSPAGSAPG